MIHVIYAKILISDTGLDLIFRMIYIFFDKPAYFILF